MADRRHTAYEFRAKLPGYVRIAALAAIAITVGLVVVGFYRQRNKTTFRLKPEHTQLSADVVAEVNGYERTEFDGETKKYYVKADHVPVVIADDNKDRKAGVKTQKQKSR